MSKRKKRRTLPSPAPRPDSVPEPVPEEEPEIPRAARWMGALCYLSVLILIPACSKWRHDEFVRFHLNQGLMLLMLSTLCGALSLAPYMEQISLSLTLLVDALSLVGLITALRRRTSALPFVGVLTARFHPFQ